MPQRARKLNAGADPDRLQSELARAIHDRSRERWGESAAAVLVGLHPKFTAALDRLARFASSESPVLITGETGTGKELFARALYLLSRRNGQPFLSINCAQYHDGGQLVASELFGHRKGAFTGADSDHAGLFEAAHRGVLFLDEVAELPPVAQAMLLRVLSEGELVPVGDTRARKVDVRVVAASSTELQQMVRDGRFRRDLYFRLRALHVSVPPVRERGDDWTLIRDYYLSRLTQAREVSKRFSAEADQVLRDYDWPGNVREVKALVDAGFHLSDGELIEPVHFLESLEELTRLTQLRSVPIEDPVSATCERLLAGQSDFWRAVHRPYLAREMSRAQVRLLLERVLARTRGSYKKALPLLGLPESDYGRFMAFLRHHNLKPE